MLQREELLNQKVILSADNSELVIVDILENKDLKEVKLVFDNGRCFLLYIAFSNNAISFANKKTQERVKEEIDNYNIDAKKIAEMVAENNRQAVARSKERAIEEAKNRPLKRGRRSESNKEE